MEMLDDTAGGLGSVGEQIRHPACENLGIRVMSAFSTRIHQSRGGTHLEVAEMRVNGDRSGTPRGMARA